MFHRYQILSRTYCFLQCKRLEYNSIIYHVLVTTEQKTKSNESAVWTRIGHCVDAVVSAHVDRHCTFQFFSQNGRMKMVISCRQVTVTYAFSSFSCFHMSSISIASAMVSKIACRPQAACHTSVLRAIIISYLDDI